MRITLELPEALGVCLPGKPGLMPLGVLMRQCATGQWSEAWILARGHLAQILL